MTLSLSIAHGLTPPSQVVFEDAHVLVVNKAAHMVVHPSAGHASGTLVNAVLHHCGLPAMRVASGATPPSALLPPGDAGDDDVDGAEAEDDEDEGGGPTLMVSHPGAVLRPGIVHRLDKGTSGLLVIAKDAASHSGLCSQFAARTVMRRYHALHLGCPGTPAARVEAPIGRDATNRLRMAVVWAPGARGVRPAASRYQLVDTLANGGAAHVHWRLETGRTHQVRVHAKYIGLPLLGDPLYGGTPGAAAAALVRCGVDKAPATAFADSLAQDRPCLHAAELGFAHPVTGQALHFEVPPPPDFMAALNALRVL
jgi:23S rRNA pseudouridine1911/1915/1917 synthase